MSEYESEDGMDQMMSKSGIEVLCRVRKGKVSRENYCECKKVKYCLLNLRNSCPAGCGLGLERALEI